MPGSHYQLNVGPWAAQLLSIDPCYALLVLWPGCRDLFLFLACQSGLIPKPVS